MLLLLLSPWLGLLSDDLPLNLCSLLSHWWLDVNLGWRNWLLDDDCCSCCDRWDVNWDFFSLSGCLLDDREDRVGGG